MCMLCVCVYVCVCVCVCARACVCVCVCVFVLLDQTCRYFDSHAPTTSPTVDCDGACPPLPQINQKKTKRNKKTDLIPLPLHLPLMFTACATQAMEINGVCGATFTNDLTKFSELTKDLYANYRRIIRFKQSEKNARLLLLKTRAQHL